MNDKLAAAFLVGFVALLVYGTLAGWFDGCIQPRCLPGEIESTFYSSTTGYGYICTPRSAR